MKENTKFLWMYVGILFSFAIILIIFAGLSQNTTSEQTMGLKSDITELSQKNTELKGQINELQKQIDALVEENNILKSDADVLSSAQTMRNKNDEILMEAHKAQRKAQYRKARELLDEIDIDSLTEAQLYIYNRLDS